MSNAVTMKYGTYNFVPVPFLTINKEFQKTPNGETVGTLFTVTVEGTLTPLPTGAVGILELDNYKDELREAFDVDGKLFEIACDGTPLISACPRILSLNFQKSNNNWTRTIPFTIELEYDDEPAGSGENSGIMPPYISTASETWSVEVAEDTAHFHVGLKEDVTQQTGPDSNSDSNPYRMVLTHAVNATGKRHYSCPTVLGTLDRPAWEEARDYVLPKLGYDSTCVSASGVINFDPDDFQAYNHVRTKEIDESAGTFGVTETWLVMNPSGDGIPGNALEDFSISLRKGQESDIVGVSIEGTIQGLETRDYGSNPGDFNITETKYTAASGYWNVVKDRLLPRVKIVADGEATRNINPAPVSTSLGHAWDKGTITYGYEYNDRPCNFISGSSFENISINDNNPVDVFAQLTVLGRAAGPVLQDINTVTAATRDVSVEVSMPIPTGCSVGALAASIAAAPTTEVDALLCQFQTELTDVYDQVFKHADQASWNPKTGQYSRNVSWTYQSCSAAPDTSFC